MTDITKKMTRTIWMLILAFTFAGMASCSKSVSYSELLREEEKAVNQFLAGQKVLLEVPEDSISFIVGKDAPFYKLDEDGYVYMQVISKGEAEKVETGDKVYFRFSRQNLKELYLGNDTYDDGNSNNIGLGDTYFILGSQSGNSANYGSGIQMPLKFFGYDCEVNLVLKSYYGFTNYNYTNDQSSCQPYLVNVRYFRPEY